MTDELAIVEEQIDKADGYVDIFGAPPAGLSLKQHINKQFARLVKIVHPDRVGKDRRRDAERVFGKIVKIRKEALVAADGDDYGRSVHTFELLSRAGTYVLEQNPYATGEHSILYRGELTRMDAAAALASVIHGDLRVFTFSWELVEVPPRPGMAGVDAVINSQRHGGTLLGQAVSAVSKLPHDRLIVVTDEQSHDHVPGPSGRGYMINVASNRHGVGYGPWVHIDGFSESVLRFIGEYESQRAG